MVNLAKRRNADSLASDIEKQLYHGTTPNAVDAICEKNFDSRECGKSSGTMYGKGSYFATNASYSHSYAKNGSDGLQYMFLARVLVGSFIKGEHEYQTPPKKDPSNPLSDLYDSCVDNERNPEIFVIFNSDQVYPEYVIKYYTLNRDGIFLTPSNFQARKTKSAGIIKSPIPHGDLTGSASNLLKPVLPRSQGLTANPWSPGTSFNANRALSHSDSNLYQQVASRRGPQGLKEYPFRHSTSVSANKALSHIATNSQQPLSAPRSSQDLATNPWRPSTSQSFNRALSATSSQQSLQDLTYNPSRPSTSLQQPLPALRRSQDFTYNMSGPSTSLSANNALERSPTSSQQLFLPALRGSHYLTYNSSGLTTSLSANRALAHSPASPQQPLPAPRSSQGGTANLVGSSDTFTATDSNTQTNKMQRDSSKKSKTCLIL